jgi:hypothetical protein
MSNTKIDYRKCFKSISLSIRRPTTEGVATAGSAFDQSTRPKHLTVETNSGLPTAQPDLVVTLSPGYCVDGPVSGSLYEVEYHTLQSLTFDPFSPNSLLMGFPVFYH